MEEENALDSYFEKVKKQMLERKGTICITTETQESVINPEKKGFWFIVKYNKNKKIKVT